MIEEGFIKTVLMVFRNSIVIGASIVVLFVLFGLASRSSGAVVGIMILVPLLIRYWRRELRRAREE